MCNTLHTSTILLEAPTLTLNAGMHVRFTVCQYSESCKRLVQIFTGMGIISPTLVNGNKDIYWGGDNSCYLFFALHNVTGNVDFSMILCMAETESQLKKGLMKPRE